MPRERSHSYTHITPDDVEVHVTFTFSGYYDSGNLSGSPENCYPPEGDLEITEVETEDGKTMTFEEWSELMRLSPKDIETIEESLMKIIQEPDDDFDDY